MRRTEPDFKSADHVRLTPNERPSLDDGIISVGWNAGTIRVQYVGLRPVSESVVAAIRDAMEEFTTECQLMAFLYAGVMASSQAVRAQLGRDTSEDGAFTLSSNYAGSMAIWARLQVGRVLDAFSENGEYERLYSKAFVVFAYQMWEESARPKIARALGVNHADVQCDLMGEWRHLRNWLVHPDESTAQAYFRNARMLTVVLDRLQPGEPEVKGDMVFPLVGYLNSLHVIVNPNQLSPGLTVTEMGPAMAAQMSKDLAESGAVEVPIWRGFKPRVSEEP